MGPPDQFDHLSTDLPVRRNNVHVIVAGDSHMIVARGRRSRAPSVGCGACGRMLAKLGSGERLHEL
jgi:hypothetical protein